MHCSKNEREGDGSDDWCGWDYDDDGKPTFPLAALIKAEQAKLAIEPPPERKRIAAARKRGNVKRSGKTARKRDQVKRSEKTQASSEQEQGGA
jgi:hypothetical protein